MLRRKIGFISSMTTWSATAQCVCPGSDAAVLRMRRFAAESANAADRTSCRGGQGEKLIALTVNGDAAYVYGTLTKSQNGRDEAARNHLAPRRCRWRR